MKPILFTAFLFLICFTGFAQSFKNEFGFKTENDAYLATLNDRYYTNGLFIYFRRAINPNKLSVNIEKKTYEVSVGQKIFTPYWGQVPKKEDQDRPFAGYLYAGGAYSVFFKNESVLKTSVELGTVGPNSLAKKAQVFLHKTVGFYTPAGWDYQITNELALNLAANYSKLLYRTTDNAIDFSGQGYANLGTTFSGAGTSVLIRAGRLNQLFNSAYHNAVIGEAKTKKLNNSELFFYVKPQLNFVAYDATIQGSLFNNDSPVTFGVKPIVFEQQFGINYSSNRFTIDFNIIFKTKEVKSVAEAQNYGGLSLYYRFH
ncbi:lipid A deacylase LpxR family protein [Pedobacter changchengzhani]|uniref:Lipid A deacylase LpxR family protein n=1 Tax=Pedobacter changchengzhani TaxID=2529274 RepID=A0A4R5MHJ6_9SPHI|nr:lipid A deacylase LpxR family protein [Pedobacter changchengzhani]TDG34951.1 lipid A deacylase LpxR family protein [Pedobacter changchengzhani]